MMCPSAKPHLSKMENENKHGHAQNAACESQNIGKGDAINAPR